MTKLRITLLTAVALTIMPFTAKSQTNDTISLSLDDCLEIALSENLSVKIADQEIEKQSYSRKSTYSSLYPQIDINGGYQRTLKKQVMSMEQNGQQISVTVGRNNNWSGTLGASMPLVNSQLWKTLQISDLDIDLAVEKSRGSRLDMINVVTECYYTVLLSVKSCEILTIALNNAKENYENVKHRYELGLSSEYDMIRSNVEVSSFEPQVFSAQNAIELAKWQLKAVIGMDLDKPIKCKGDLEEYKSIIHSEIEQDFSLENNTTMRQFDIQLDQMAKTVQLYKRAYIPTLSLQYQYQIYAMENYYDFANYNWIPYSTAALGLNIPIFSGMKKMNDIRKTKVQENQLKIQKEDTQRELYVAAKQIISTMETNVKKYDAANATVDQAIRGYEISKKRYDTGKGTILEVNDSRLAAIEARLNLDEAIYNYLVAKASLDKIIGSAIE